MDNNKPGPSDKPRIKVVSQDEAEEADLVMCVYTGMEQEEFKADNVYTTCPDCGRDITHRPHVPKNPPKVCIACAFNRMKDTNQ